MTPFAQFFIRLTLCLPLLWGNMAHAKTLKILFLGDSITAGYGLPQRAGYPEQLAQKLSKHWGINVVAINAGVSGDTSTGLLNRLAWATAQPYDVAVVAIGGNDALLGISPEKTRKNLDQILNHLTQSKKTTIALGMLAPPNLGTNYAKNFNAIYPDLTKQYGIPLYPFVLKDVATIAKLNQPDQIHPNQKGVEVIVGNLFEFFVGNIQGK